MSGVRKIKLTERLYRAFIYSCVGASGLSTLYLVSLSYSFFFVTKPKIEEEKKVHYEEMLKEGREIADELKDKAANVTT